MRALQPGQKMMRSAPNHPQTSGMAHKFKRCRGNSEGSVASFQNMALAKEPKKVLRRIVDAMVDEYRPERIVLFGSYAYGDADSESDIDLLIIKHTSGRFIDRRTEIRRILSDPNRMISVEPLVLTPEEVSDRLARGDQFIEEIVNNGETLYVR